MTSLKVTLFRFKLIVPFTSGCTATLKGVSSVKPAKKAPISTSFAATSKRLIDKSSLIVCSLFIDDNKLCVSSLGICKGAITLGSVGLSDNSCSI